MGHWAYLSLSGFLKKRNLQFVVDVVVAVVMCVNLDLILQITGYSILQKRICIIEVGEWLSFNVTSMMQEDIGEFILHASYLGVNKNIQLRSNDYWDASKRPKLQIWYEE